MSDAVTDAKASATASSGEMTHKQIMTILAGLMMGMFLASLDQTIVSTAIRTIGDDLHGLDAQAWVTTAYLITSTIATPLYGKLSDIFGRRPFYLFAIAVFIIGSVACTFANSMYMLAAFRAVQGIGAGGLMSLALAIIGDILPPRERAKYQGYFLAVFGTTSVLGPVIGGFFAEQSTLLGLSGWRWVFLINVPIGLAAFAVVAKTLHLRHHRTDHRIDYWGAAALTIGLVPLLTVAEQGRAWGWGSTKSVTCFVIGALGLIGFYLAERMMKDEALIPLRIFRSRAVSVTIVASIIVGMAMFGAMMMLPLYMQIVHNASPMKSGLMMLPLVMGMMSASIVSGQLTAKTGAVRIFPIIGTAFMALGMFLLSHISADTHLWLVMLYMVLVGMGLGNCMQALTLIVQNAVAPREIGMATSSATFFRQMGGTIGVAVFLSMLFTTVGDNIKTALQDASKTPEFGAALKQAASDPNLMKDKQAYGVVQALVDPKHHGGGLESVSSDSSVIGRLPDAVAHPFQQGFADSMDHVFLTATGIAILGFLVLLLLPKIELRSQSAMAAKAAEADASATASASDKPVAQTSAQPTATSTGSTAAASTSSGDASVDASAQASEQTSSEASDRPHYVGEGTTESAVNTASAYGVGHTIHELNDTDCPEYAADGTRVDEAVAAAADRVARRADGKPVERRTPRHAARSAREGRQQRDQKRS